MSITVKFPKARMRLAGEDGNAYAIMGRATKALRAAGATKEDTDAYMAEAMSGDYNNLLRTTMSWVNCDGRGNTSTANESGALDNVVIIVPAGEYWLGDPCYSVRDEDWMPWLEAANYTEGSVLWAQVPGTEHWVLGLGTQFGDGCYTDEHGNEYGVDAGLIGLVPVAYNPTTNYTLDANGRNEYGASGIARKVVFDKPTKCFIDTRGEKHGGQYHTLTFGSIKIETGDGDEDECEACGETESNCACEWCPVCDNLVEYCECDEDDDN